MPVTGFDDLDVMDYGCGPGHDLIGMATYSPPASLIGLDVSARALEIAQRRITLHGFGDQVGVKKIEETGIELPDESIDYIHSSGVLHHVNDLESILTEFSRVLRPDGRVRLMVYNRECFWWHLYVPYVMQIRRKILDPKMPLSEAFRMSTDGFDCPISEAYTAETFGQVAAIAGFVTTEVGASISHTELDSWRRFHEKAVSDNRLSLEHRDFLLGVSESNDGQLSRFGKVPGINLTLELKKDRLVTGTN